MIFKCISNIYYENFCHFISQISDYPQNQLFHWKSNHNFIPVRIPNVFYKLSILKALKSTSKGRFILCKTCAKSVINKENNTKKQDYFLIFQICFQNPNFLGTSYFFAQTQVCMPVAFRNSGKELQCVLQWNFSLTATRS